MNAVPVFCLSEAGEVCSDSDWPQCISTFLSLMLLWFLYSVHFF